MTHSVLSIACFVSISGVLLGHSSVAAQIAHAPTAKPATSAHAQFKRSPCYNLVERRVVDDATDTLTNERLWDVQIASLIPPQTNQTTPPPDYLFKSLDSPILLKWVETLPPKSEICFDIETGPREKFSSPVQPSPKDPLAKLRSEIDVFAQFCTKHHVNVVITEGGG